MKCWGSNHVFCQDGWKGSLEICVTQNIETSKCHLCWTALSIPKLTHYSTTVHCCVPLNIHDDITSILHYHLPQISAVFLTHIRAAHSHSQYTARPPLPCLKLTTDPRRREFGSISSLVCGSGTGLHLCYNLDISCRLNKRSQKEGPLSSGYLWEEMTEGNWEWCKPIKRAKKKKKKDTNKGLQKDRGLGNRWREKRHGYHEGRLPQGENKGKGWGPYRAKAGVKSKGWRKKRESSVVSRERTAGDGGIMTEGGACLTPSDLFLDPAAGKRWRKWAQQTPNVMGYPAACLLTRLPLRVMSVPIVSAAPLQDESALSTDTNTQNVHSQTPRAMTHTCSHARAQMDPCAGLHTRSEPETHPYAHEHTSSWLNNTRSQGRFHSGHCITQKWRTVLKLLQRRGRAVGLQIQKLCQGWHQQKQYYHAVQCSWFGLLSANKDHYPSQGSLTHRH